MTEDVLWTGDDWEEYCLALAQQHYGADELQRVPAANRGDLGIEAFTFSGVAIQCYAHQGHLPVGSRYVKQRDKLTTDTNKLREKRDQLRALLGPTVIRRYLFLVPIHDSHQLVTHATTKSAEIRSWGLDIIHPEFRIVVCEAGNAFPHEKAALEARPRAIIEQAAPPTAAVATWMDENPSLIETALAKLAPVVPDPRSREKYVDQLATQHLKGDQILAKLRLRYTDQWEAAERCANEKERVLSLEYPQDHPESSTQNITQIAQHLAAEMRELVPELGPDNSKSLSWRAVSDWLMRCPLDFGTGDVVENRRVSDG